MRNKFLESDLTEKGIQLELFTINFNKFRIFSKIKAAKDILPSKYAEIFKDYMRKFYKDVFESILQPPIVD